MKRYILKTKNIDGIPNRHETTSFQEKYGIHINDIVRLYVSFKVGKRRKIKRLRIAMSHACECCGSHAYVAGKVGDKEFYKERDLLI